jgi:hypothetical protein
VLPRSCLTVLLVAFAGRCCALTIGLDPVSESSPTQFSYPKGSAVQLELTLGISNPSAVESQPVLLWQLGLRVRASASSTGHVLLGDILLPESSLFSASSMPSTGDDLPGDDVVASDSDPAFEGVSIPAQAARNIVSLPLSISGDAKGMFVLSMSGYDENNLDRSSFWIPSSDDLPMLPFDNGPNSPNGSEVDLAIIYVVEPSLKGDYNHNGVVDAADYTVWRDTLGRAVPRYSGADGNGSGVIDAGDNALWKEHFGAGKTVGAASSVFSSNVPEPSSAVIFSLGVVSTSFALRRRASAALRKPAIPPSTRESVGYEG